MSKRLSDFNTSGYRPSIVDSASRLHSDLDFSLISVGSPGFKRLFPLTDLDAIKNSMKNLILTNVYDRPFQPGLGSNVTNLLFENAEPLTQHRIATEIKRVIEKHEPRISNLQVEVSDLSENNAYDISVLYSFEGRSGQTGRFILKRLR